MKVILFSSWFSNWEADVLRLMIWMSWRVWRNAIRFVRSQMIFNKTFSLLVEKFVLHLRREKRRIISESHVVSQNKTLKSYQKMFRKFNYVYKSLFRWFFIRRSLREKSRPSFCTFTSIELIFYWLNSWFDHVFNREEEIEY